VSWSWGSAARGSSGAPDDESDRESDRTSAPPLGPRYALEEREDDPALERRRSTGGGTERPSCQGYTDMTKLNGEVRTHDAKLSDTAPDSAVAFA
jgi:hypothetical protein